MSKENDMRFIKGFTKITIKGVCEDLNIDMFNLNKGKTSEKNTKRVKEEIKKRFKELERCDSEY